MAISNISFILQFLTITAKITYLSVLDLTLNIYYHAFTCFELYIFFFLQIAFTFHVKSNYIHR